MAVLEKITRYLNRVLMFVGGVFLAAMVILTCANIAARIAWIPIKGTFELMGFFGAVVTTFALAYTQMRRGHISVDVLVNSFSQKVRTLLTAANHLLCVVFFSLASWTRSEPVVLLKTNPFWVRHPVQSCLHHNKR